MSICPQFLCIRPCKENTNSDDFSPPAKTSFGFIEFVSNIPEEIKVQNLYCHEFKSKDTKKCGTSGFIEENNINICKEVTSNFHLCIKNNKGLIYIYFQQRGKLHEMNCNEVLEKLTKIHEFNCNSNTVDGNDDICLIILICGKPSHSTSNIAIENKKIKDIETLSNEKEKNYTKIKVARKIQTISIATRLTFSNNEKYPFGLNIVGS